MIFRIKSIVIIAILLGALVSAINVSAQQTVTFVTKDGLTVTADHYVVDVNFPYILLLHQAGFSRGEYRQIAPKLVKMGYNCLAIDQRSGGEVGFVPNATAARAAEQGLSQSYIDALPDIEAALAYIKQRSDKPIVLWGSSYSASLALLVAPKDLRVGALLVFSPGEYLTGVSVAEGAAKVSVPVFVTSSHGECEQVRQVCAGIKPELLTTYCPAMPGEHGSKALWETNPSHADYWLGVAMFFSRLRIQK